MNFKIFSPLIAIFSLILVFTLGMQVAHGWSFDNAMLDFMAGFFLIFGTFKVLQLKAFAKAYGKYDLFAMRSRVYAYFYPFIEVGLSLAYVLRWELKIVNWVGLALMAASTVGVLVALLRREKIECACLGTVFKLPMTKVTLAENLLMLTMAIYMVYAFSLPSTYTIEHSMTAVNQSTVNMTLEIKDGWGQAVTNFDTVHTRKMHLIGVRTDLQEFLHVHPDMTNHGTWVVQIPFPSDGAYQFYADFTPTGDKPQVLTFAMSIGEYTAKKLHFYGNPVEVDGYQVTYHFPDDIKTGDISYSLSVEKDGQPVTEFENYLGAKGHSVVIEQGSMAYQHVHALDSAEPSFMAHFMKAGTYAVFTQIQINDKLLTVPFVIQVEEGEAMEGAMMH